MTSSGHPDEDPTLTQPVPSRRTARADFRPLRARALLRAGLQSDSTRADAPGVTASDSTPGPASALTDPARLLSLRTNGLLEALPGERFDRLTRMAVRVTGAAAAIITLVDADRRVVLSSTGLAAPWDAGETPAAQTLCRHVVQQGGPVVVEDLRDHPTLRHGDLGAVAYAGTPIRSSDGHVVGVLAALHPEPRPWTQDDRDALADLAAVAVSEIELRRMAGRLRSEARTDTLTGLGNRRHWLEESARAVGMARATREPLVLALLDLDRFRRFNDRYGSHAGDALLRDIAARWRAALREGDGLMRMGGVQFALLMPATGLDPAFDVVERLRTGLSAGLTCSAALAMLRDGEDAEALLERADAALVRAKRSGRNVSTLAS